MCLLVSYFGFLSDSEGPNKYEEFIPVISGYSLVEWQIVFTRVFQPLKDRNCCWMTSWLDLTPLLGREASFQSWYCSGLFATTGVCVSECATSPDALTVCLCLCLVFITMSLLLRIVSFCQTNTQRETNARHSNQHHVDKPSAGFKL